MRSRPHIWHPIPSSISSESEEPFWLLARLVSGDDPHIVHLAARAALQATQASEETAA